MTDQLDQTTHGPVVTHDLIRSLLGERIGYGISREVYSVPLARHLVAKVARIDSVHPVGIIANVQEYATWEAVTMFPDHVRQWFCPCHSISIHGTTLFMERAEPINREQLPKDVPVYFTDLKLENWGMYKGKPVCLDYANLLIVNQLLSKRTKKATW